MPGYDIKGFTNDVQIWQNYDALHCRTKGIADREMLYISHIPLHDTVSSSNGAGYSINVTVIPYSGENIIEDSLLVFYKPEGASEFSEVKMEFVSGNEYKAVIPQQPKSGAMAYYVHAADKSGRSENHPYIGQPDPHVFYAESQGNAIYASHIAANGISTFKNYPNPFTEETRIVVKLKSIAKNARIVIYSNNGQLIREWPITGTSSSVRWNGTDQFNRKVAAGIYFYVIDNGKMRVTRRMQMVK